MSESTKVAMIVPFRDRGLDPLRRANLDLVQAWWFGHQLEIQIVDDGLSRGAQFNRHRAYNRAVEMNPEADVFVFTEADMLIHPDQIREAVELALEKPGLVVPFTQYRYLSKKVSEFLRNAWYDMDAKELARWWALPTTDLNSIFDMRAEKTMENGKSIGAVNVVSRETLEITGGFTEATHGNWYDDNIIEEGFAFLTKSKTRWVKGPAVHLYHLPGWTGDHLSEADREATARNKRILLAMRDDIRTKRKVGVQNLMRFRQAVRQGV